MVLLGVVDNYTLLWVECSYFLDFQSSADKKINCLIFNDETSVQTRVDTFFIVTVQKFFLIVKKY